MFTVITTKEQSGWESGDIQQVARDLQSLVNKPHPQAMHSPQTQSVNSWHCAMTMQPMYIIPALQSLNALGL